MQKNGLESRSIGRGFLKQAPLAIKKVQLRPESKNVKTAGTHISHQSRKRLEGPDNDRQHPLRDGTIKPDQH